MADEARKTPVELIPEDGFVIEFEGVSDAQAGQLATQLKDDIEKALREENSEARVEQVRTDPESLDPGTILAVILGSKATVVVAYGIYRWLARKNRTKASIYVRDPDGRVVRIEIVDDDPEHLAKQIEAVKSTK